MKTLFLEENNKFSGILKKIVLKNNRIIINKEIDKIKLKSKIKLAEKIKDILEKEKVRQIAVTKKIKQDGQFMNLLYSNNINVCNEKWTFRKNIDKIIDILINEAKIEESELWICANEVDPETEECIYKFAKEFKTINIITNHIWKFKKIEERLYNESGILINLTNNRRKSLQNAKIILNVDFPKEIMNEFAIYEKSIIINWGDHLKINKKRFSGKIIEEIKLEKDYEFEKFIENHNLQDYDERDICQVYEIIPECKMHI